MTLIHPGRFDGRVAVVTGGASGIGLATVRRLLAEGAAVVAGDRDAESLERLSGELGERFATVAIDVRREADLETLVATAVERFGGLHVAVNAAGIGEGAPILEQDAAQWAFVLDVCLNGIFYSVKQEGRQMAEQGGGGAIVNIASINCRLPAHGATAYSTAKAGVEMVTRNAALELGELGIRVNAIAPGLVDTPMAARTGHAAPAVRDAWLRHIPLGRVGRPDDIAAAATFLLSEDAAWISGTTLFVDGGGMLTAYPDLRAALASGEVDG
jgi:NAD(P)-dependent dehydrogenase (short-subunit alcohol dehydrogenase family)